jgi:uncharacterized membrane protein
VVFVSVLDEKNSAIIVEDIGDEAEEEEKLQQPENLDNVDIDIVDFGPEGERSGAFYTKILMIFGGINSKT